MTSQAPSRPTMNIGNAKHLLLQLLPEKDTTFENPLRATEIICGAEILENNLCYKSDLATVHYCK